MGSVVEQTSEGITEFEVTVGRAKDYQSTTSTIRYTFGRPVSLADYMVREAEVAGLAAELAERRVDQLVAQKQAEVQAAVEQQTRTVTPPPQPSQYATAGAAQVVATWRTASHPKGNGKVKYRPSSELSSDSLKAMVRAAIAETGANPDLHAVYDERVGAKGLEATNQGYRFCSVKPTDSNPAAAFCKNDKGYTDASFYVDFNDDGTVRVKQTDRYTQACQEARTPVPPTASNELPF